MKKLERNEMKNLKGGVTDPGVGCGTGGDFCGVNNGIEYNCCTTDRNRLCVNNVCEEPVPEP